MTVVCLFVYSTNWQGDLEFGVSPHQVGSLGKNG